MSVIQKPRHTKQKFPFNNKQISELIILEEKNSDNYQDKTIMAQLINIYTQLVEYYDSMSDPIKIYFVEKMQNVIFKASKNYSKKTPIKYMEKFKSDIRTLGTGLVNAKNDRINQSERPIENPEQLMERRKVRRAMEIKLTKKVEAEQNVASHMLIKEIDTVNKKYNHNSKIVNQQLSSQDFNLSKKLADRRQKSMNKSLQKTFNGGFRDRSAVLANSKIERFNNTKDEELNPNNILSYIDSKESPYE